MLLPSYFTPFTTETTFADTDGRRCRFMLVVVVLDGERANSPLLDRRTGGGFIITVAFSDDLLEITGDTANLFDVGDSIVAVAGDVGEVGNVI